MQREFKIDWLQFSADVVYMPITEGEEPKPEKSSQRFYRSMQKYSSGLVVHHGNPNTGRPLYVLTGKVCDRLCVGQDLLKNIIYDWKGSIGRLDLAMTVDVPILDKIMRDKDKVVSEMYQECKAIVDGDMTVETIYFGDQKKRGKKGIVRCYDKGKQLDLSDCLLHRIEVENKGKNATVAGKRIVRGEPIGDVMNAKFRIDAEWYKDLVGDGVSNSRFSNDVDEDMTDIERKIMWIHNQVIPSMQDIIDYDIENGTTNFYAILDRLNYRNLPVT